jgi:hypothetical protein
MRIINRNNVAVILIQLPYFSGRKQIPSAQMIGHAKASVIFRFPPACLSV